MSRRVITIVLAALSPWGRAAAEPPPVELRTYCVACHNAEDQEADLNLEDWLNQPEQMANEAALLNDLLVVIEDGDMPPKKARAKPGDAERAVMVDWLNARLEALAQIQKDDPGPVLLARLTKNEYRHVIRDLSGGVVTRAADYLPNEGGAGEGFANVGEAQRMTLAQLEKYLEAAKGALRHARVYPYEGLVWDAIPREPANEPAAARKAVVDDIIAWFVAQQQKWGEEHRDDLNRRLGFVHACYLEASWVYEERDRLGKAKATIDDIARGFDPPLAPAALEKWHAILTSKEPDKAFAAWAAAWKKLPKPPANSPAHSTLQRVRDLCIAIERGVSDAATEVVKADFAPPYEISFLDSGARDVTLKSVARGVWPFMIELDGAPELFLVVTDAGDGNRGEFGAWRRGRVHFMDGTVKPWEEVVEVFGARSGKRFPWGQDKDNAISLTGDAIGVQPPGALTFKLPPNARYFEVEFVIDPAVLGDASIQALVLKEKPKSTSYVEGRLVFGGRNRDLTATAMNKDLEKNLRRRNLSEANSTKVGLNSERNIFRDWKHTPLESIGGPWPDQTPDKFEPNAPYHYTVPEILRNATPEDLGDLRRLEHRLVSIVQQPWQDLLARTKDAGWDEVREGVMPPAGIAARLEPGLKNEVRELEDRLESDARKVLVALARPAWRRPVAGEDVEPLLAVYRRSRQQGTSYEAAVKTALLGVLASPNFLFRGGFTTEDTGIHREFDKSPPRNSVSSAVRPLSSLELASRLSFFLWASIPDDELLALAEANRLQEAEVLRDQAMRMLRDPRAQSLATDFAAQLWQFSDFETFTGPDEKRFKDFTPGLRAAMLDETVRFIADVFQNDRPLGSLLNADWTFASPELAKFYGIEGGDQEGRFDVPAERGGLATMALFLTKTSLPLRTSPVQRGNWITEALLGRELPPPPAMVPALSEDETNDAGENIRQQLERHRADAACAGCHAKIDPPGIALENFDPIGRWRDAERDGRPIANTETTHDGVELKGVAGLKTYLTRRKGEFFTHLNRKLLGYALGRAVGPGDKALLDRMQTRLAHPNERFADLVEEIVLSQQFRSRNVSLQP